jgi:hypothetical protein
MYTLFRLYQHRKRIQYVLMIAFIGGFIIFLELLKPRPFAGLMRIAADYIGFVRTQSPKPGSGASSACARHPCYALLYIAAIPVLFIHGVAVIFSRVIMALTWVS